MHRLVQDKQDEIAAVCRKYRVRRLDVFGSAVTRDFNPERSDIDLLVEFEVSPLDDPWSYFLLQEELSALLGRRVDLVEPAGIRNDIYRRAIEAQRELLYAA